MGKTVRRASCGAAALAGFRDARDRDDELEVAHIEYAALLAATRDYEAAIAAYEQGLAAHPENRAMLKGLSLASYRIEDYKRALDTAVRLTLREDTEAADFVWLATVSERIGDTNEAQAAYERALATDPGNWLAANNLSALLRDSDPERAVELAETAVDLSGGVPEVRDTLGRAYLSSGNPAEAAKVFAALSEGDATSARYALMLGRARLAAEDRDGAVRAFETAAALDGPDAEAARTELDALRLGPDAPTRYRRDTDAMPRPGSDASHRDAAQFLTFPPGRAISRPRKDARQSGRCGPRG